MIACGYDLLLVVDRILGCRVLACGRVVCMRVVWSECTLEMAGNVLKGGWVAINVERSHIGGVSQAQLLFEEPGEVGGS